MGVIKVGEREAGHVTSNR